jgi:hypothetical protein
MRPLKSLLAAWADIGIGGKKRWIENEPTSAKREFENEPIREGL